MEFIFVTGMSGAGKSSAADALEDLGYYCIDNIPPALIPSFVDLAVKGDLEFTKMAIVTDTRSGESFANINDIFNTLAGSDINFKILFLDASDSKLARRYSETRRRHPLSDLYDIPLNEAIAKERKMLSSVRGRASYVIDTTELVAGQLKKQLSGLFSGGGNTSLKISVMSFGYKYGAPMEGSLIFDVRCLPNPFYIDELKPLTGLDSRVSDYVMQFDSSKEMAKRILNLVEFATPLYRDEGKSHLVIGVGCTGGKHRSVAFAELIYKMLVSKGYRVSVSHRDIEKF